jgi:HAD superfamily hydrolase (TIGR01490 family)
MALAIFDLDNTLIAGDSDHLWGDFLVQHNIVDSDHYQSTNDQFYQDYLNGQLDIRAYQRFALKVLTEHPVEQLYQWREQFIQDVIMPIMLPQANTLLAKHRARGDFLLIITATNDFVAAPIAKLLGVDHLLATIAAQTDARAASSDGSSDQHSSHHYSGDISGVPCYREGKVTRLYEWLESSGHTLENSYFYSDSHNDLPLLKIVQHAVAVDPDTELEREALAHGWPVISLREA